MVPPWLGGGLADGDTKGPEEPAEGGEENPPDVNPFNQYAYMYNQYYSSAKTEKVTREDLLTKDQEFKDKIEPLRVTIEKLEKPDGSQDHPARTCRDLKQHYPEKTSGTYWIDPNLGCISDAIEVKCKFENVDDENTVTTCVDSTEGVKVDNWGRRMKSKDKMLFGEEHGLGELKYAADQSQLEYLGLLSAKATQEITIKCSNYDAHKNIAWVGTRNTEFSKGADSIKYRPEVIKDDCRNMSDDSQTVLRFNTHKFVRLPVVDFRPDHSEEGHYGVTLGAVCFA